MNAKRICTRACLGSYVVFLTSAGVATSTVLWMIWSGSATEMQWRIVSTSLALLVFSLLVLVGTKALREATTVGR
jgi:hypothetical protein